MRTVALNSDLEPSNGAACVMACLDRLTEDVEVLVGIDGFVARQWPVDMCRPSMSPVSSSAASAVSKSFIIRAKMARPVRSSSTEIAP